MGQEGRSFRLTGGIRVVTRLDAIAASASPAVAQADERIEVPVGDGQDLRDLLPALDPLPPPLPGSADQPGIIEANGGIPVPLTPRRLSRASGSPTVWASGFSVDTRDWCCGFRGILGHQGRADLHSTAKTWRATKLFAPANDPVAAATSHRRSPARRRQAPGIRPLFLCRNIKVIP